MHRSLRTTDVQVQPREGPLQGSSRRVTGTNKAQVPRMHIKGWLAFHLVLTVNQNHLGNSAQTRMTTYSVLLQLKLALKTKRSEKYLNPKCLLAEPFIPLRTD